MSRKRLTGRDKKNFIKAKIWWATGDVGMALMESVNEANRLFAIDIREKSRNYIKGKRPDSKPFPQDVLAKSTGQFRKNSVARPGDKAAKFYRRASLNVIEMDRVRGKQGQVLKNAIVRFKNSSGTKNYRVPTWLVGPVNGGLGPTPRNKIGSMTVAKKQEKGGSQLRKWRKVPAIKQRGKRNAYWDGEWRTEFWDIKKTPRADKPETKRLRYLMLAQKGWIPWQKTDTGARDWTAYHNIPWQKGLFKQGKKSFMVRGLKKASTRARKKLQAAKQYFPKYARKFVKLTSGKGINI